MFLTIFELGFPNVNIPYLETSGATKAHMIGPHSFEQQQRKGVGGGRGAFGFTQLDEKCHLTRHNSQILHGLVCQSVSRLPLRSTRLQQTMQMQRFGSRSNTQLGFVLTGFPEKS